MCGPGDLAIQAGLFYNCFIVEPENITVLSIPKIPPELIIFKPNKIRMLLFSIGLWIFFILLELLLYWAIYIERNISGQGFLAFWGLLLFLPVIFFYNVIAFFPKEGWLTLNSEGFQLNSFLKSRRYKYKWDEVQEFCLTYQLIQRAKIERISFTVNIAGILRQKHFAPFRYQTSTQEIVHILNDWKSRFTTPIQTLKGDKGALERCQEAYLSGQPRSTIHSPSSQTVEYAPIDPRIEKMTNRWGCGFAILGVILFFAFIIMIDSTERSIYKFYNFQKDKQPSLILTVKNEYAEGFSIYQLPPIPYQHKLELSIPTPERGDPIQIQYSFNDKTECRRLQKQYGNFGQMDAI